MALKQDYEIKVTYRLGLSSPNELYDGILTDEQIGQLQSEMDKVFIVSNAYHRIDKLEGAKNLINILVGTYNESVDRLIKNENYLFIPNLDNGSENFFKQGYDYLKTLPEFANSVDILEEG